LVAKRDDQILQWNAGSIFDLLGHGLRYARRFPLGGRVDDVRGLSVHSIVWFPISRCDRPSGTIRGAVIPTAVIGVPDAEPQENTRSGR